MPKTARSNKTPPAPPIPGADFVRLAFDLPPERAVRYLRDKLPQASWNWDELAASAHRKAFTVAKLLDLDLLTTLHNELQRAQREGVPIEQFKKELGDRLKRAGWWGKVTDLKTGNQVLLGSPWRLETIYRTNLQGAYQAGRMQQQIVLRERRPYWQYLAVGDSRTRPAHALLNGIVLRATDPFWETSYPPNGFGCRCKVRTLSDKQLEREGLVVTDATRGPAAAFRPDKGFDAAPTDPHEPDLKVYPKNLADAYRKDVISPQPKPKAATRKRQPKEVTPPPRPVPPTTPKRPGAEIRREIAALMADRPLSNKEIYNLEAKIINLQVVLKLPGVSEARRDAVRSEIQRLEGQIQASRNRPDANKSVRELIHERFFFKAEPAKFKAPPERSFRYLPSAHRQDVLDGIEWVKRVVGTGRIDDCEVQFAFVGTRAHFQPTGGPKDRSHNVVTMTSVRMQKTCQTAVHELGHMVEFRWPAAQQAAAAWLARRTRGERVRKLSELTNNLAYRSNEVAMKDQFFSPYIGKVYPTMLGFTFPPTEVISMGLEHLYADPVRLIEQDPDMFDMLWDLFGNH